jgi:hypothetical protein
MRRGVIAAVSLAAAAGAPVSAEPGGAILGHTGGFGGETCAACHFAGEDVDDLDAAFEGAPGPYIPGERYEFFLTLADSSADVAGFQLSIRFEDGSQAGSLEALGDGAMVKTEESVQYATHTEPREVDENGRYRFKLLWNAPELGSRPVILNAAAVTAVKDMSPVGDNTHDIEVLIVPD